MNTGKALAALQYRTHLAIDDIYAPIAVSVADLVRRFGIPGIDGIARLLFSSIALLKSDVSRLLQSAHSSLTFAIVQAARDAEQIADPVGESNEAALFLTGQTAITSLFVNQSAVDAQVEKLLVRGATLKLPIAEIAKAVSQYVSPWFATRRDASGQLLRVVREGILKHWPGQAGMASAHARLVMLTETTAAHARGVGRQSRRDGMLMKWNLSAGHAESDACDDHAQRSSRGFGRGLYLPSEFPRMPEHPRCRCYASSVSIREGRAT